MISPAFFASTLLLAQGTSPQPSFGGGMLVPILCFGVIFYFGIIRPQQKRTKDLQTLVSSLKTGDKVITASGIHGIVANIKDGPTLSLKIADNVRIEIDKTAIATVVTDKDKDKEVAAPAKALVS